MRHLKLLPGPNHQRYLAKIEELEREHTPRDQEPDRIQRFPQLLLPFGFAHERWIAFKAAMKPGDELWEYCSAKETWDQGLGMAGIELVRDGKVVAHLMTRMN